VEAGAALYRKKGCYECHVEEAQGGPQGPRLGPNPIPQARFAAYVRNPTGDLPPFTERVLTNQELADIYAFIEARAQPKAVSTVPLLSQ
jgi:ubiquinol-cytochrome c reductase cytochrome c subunit